MGNFLNPLNFYYTSITQSGLSLKFHWLFFKRRLFLSAIWQTSRKRRQLFSTVNWSAFPRRQMKHKFGGYCYYSFTLFIIFDCPCFLATANSVSSTTALLYLNERFNVGCVYVSSRK